MKTIFIPTGVFLEWSNIKVVDPVTRRTVTIARAPTEQAGYVPVYWNEEAMRKELGNDVEFTVQFIAEEGDAPIGFPDV